MECGITLFAEHRWFALLTWGAFVAVLTFLAVLVRGRRGSPASDPAGGRGDLERISERVEELSRRLQAIERRIPPE